MKKLSSLLLLLCGWLALQAQPAGDYYLPATGYAGAELKTALCHIIRNHSVRSYDQLWDDFRSTDCRPDGKVWDMYSSITNYTFGTDQAGNYSREGDVYNREHSFPKSWFNDASPMYTDLFHIVPTDGYVNNRRGNYPFGETSAPTYVSSGSWSKVGPSSDPSYSGTVFEPNDEYKGDFARIYFYMVTCYEDKLSTWDSPMLDGRTYPAYSDWALDMLLRWAAEDPVSPKEEDRNDAVYALQGNRNPFVDFPGLEQYVWGSLTAQPFDPTQYETPSTTPAAPEFSPVSGSVVAKGSNIVIGSNLNKVTVHYTLNGGAEQTGIAPLEVPVYEETVVRACAQSGTERSEWTEATYYVKEQTEPAGNLYVLVTQPSELAAGSSYLIVCEEAATALSAATGNYRSCVPVTISGEYSIETETNASGYPTSVTLGRGTSTGNWTLTDNATDLYLALNRSENQLHTTDQPQSTNAQWTIDISSTGVATIRSVAYPKRSIQYNAQSPRFACYQSVQKEISLFRQTIVDGIAPTVQVRPGTVEVFTTDGRLVRSGVTLEQALDGLHPGIYIVGGKKVLIR